MKSYNNNVSFIDMLFVMLLGFVVIMFLAFLLINPVAKEGVIDPKTKMMIMVQWPDKSLVDIDLWVRGPDGKTVSYQAKNRSYMVLERDDLGADGDTYIIDGKIMIVYRNLEMLMINDLIPGEYVVNLHNYSSIHKMEKIEENKEEYPTPVKIEIVQLDPYRMIYTTNVKLEFRDELTVLTFVVDDQKRIYDKRTDVQIPLFNPFGTPSTHPGDPRNQGAR